MSISDMRMTKDEKTALHDMLCRYGAGRILVTMADLLRGAAENGNNYLYVERGLRANAARLEACAKEIRRD